MAKIKSFTKKRTTLTVFHCKKASEKAVMSTVVLIRVFSHKPDTVVKVLKNEQEKEKTLESAEWEVTSG